MLDQRKALQDLYLQQVDQPISKQVFKKYQQLEIIVMESLKQALDAEGVFCSLIMCEEPDLRLERTHDLIGTGAYLTGRNFSVYCAPQNNEFKLVITRPYAAKSEISLLTGRNESFLGVSQTIQSIVGITAQP